MTQRQHVIDEDGHAPPLPLSSLIHCCIVFIRSGLCLETELPVRHNPLRHERDLWSKPSTENSTVFLLFVLHRTKSTNSLWLSTKHRKHLLEIRILLISPNLFKKSIKKSRSCLSVKILLFNVKKVRFTLTHKVSANRKHQLVLQEKEKSDIFTQRGCIPNKQLQ